MDKSLKITLLVIGIITVLAGIYRVFFKGESDWDAYWGIFIGITIIAGMLKTKPKKDKED